LCIVCRPAHAGEAKGRLVVNLCGDITLAGTADEILLQTGYGFAFDEIRELLKSGNVNFANLEGPVTERGDKADKKYTYRMKKEALEAVKDAGFNLLSVANNHILDYGVHGLEDTLKALDERGLAHAGAGMNVTEARGPAIIKVAGYRVGLLAYSLTLPEEFYAEGERPGTAFGHMKFIEKDIPEAVKKTDILIVSFHWGTELKNTPNDYQVELGRKALELGATIVAGHHPHIAQPVEVGGGGVIFYSLGNLAFGSYSKSATRAIIGRVTIEDGRISRVEMAPLNTFNEQVYFSSRIIEGPGASTYMKELSEISAPFGTVIELRDGSWIAEEKKKR